MATPKRQDASAAPNARAKPRAPKVKPMAAVAKKAVESAKSVAKAKSVEVVRAGRSGAERAGTTWAQFADDGNIDPLKVARDLGITKADLAETLGLPADALLREERIRADKTQARLCELVEILNRVESWSGGLRSAFAWYRGAGIPALGDETAEAMVKTNRAAHVRSYLNAVAAGAFA